jgi:hypothetical protein
MKNDMTLSEAINFVKSYQRWRRGGHGDMPDPETLGIALDMVIKAAELRNYAENPMVAG